MKKFKAGDHLVTNIDPLGLTEHHGLYVGNGMVIHQTKGGIIEEVSLEIFSDGNEVRVKRRVPMPKLAIYEARYHIGNNRYQLFASNCEHFVNKVADKRSTSNQVSNIEHIVLQGITRSGMVGQSALRVANSASGTVTLVSTASKMAGEYIGLPDSINTIIGIPGDMVAKPLETAINGASRTLSDTFECISDGEYGSATGKLLEGTVLVPIETALSSTEVSINGIKAVRALIGDVWDWMWN
ncbi:lecithin retinol acyltransferase family protein [Shewanella algae]|uniref:lecithin retinol acyltransferase family protein n=1 Tax=Shewanella algae TaxID=38313 RepID=UPI001AAE8B96|nr:lecithin retinol acyltransferase family protein [Shewanella algae]MBO2583549.1 lecithin retinol acyltransferase family protein [Shewanella algae]